ncbi:MAG: hypothetical protein JNL79_36025 [Myxococcales bacterium]|nr:hypothetical protein [Myxococcales bacterium]
MKRTSCLVAVVTLGMLVGCGGSPDPESGALDDTGEPGGETGGGFELDGGDGGLGLDGGVAFDDLVIEPSNAVVTIDTSTTPPTAATLAYKGTINSGGTLKDVTAGLSLTLDDTAVGAFTGTTFNSVTSLPGGKLGITTVVRGSAEGKTGYANLTVIQLRKKGEKKDFFFTVPYLGKPSPDRDVLTFGTNIKQVDVAFNMDTTGSMGGAVTNLRTNLSTTVIPALSKAIPSVGVAIVDHKDYPVCSHGGAGYGTFPGDFPAKVHQIVTTDIAKAQAATTKYVASGGADGPESQIPSMWHILTGGALNWTGGTVAAHTPAPGTFGGVDFRPGSLPVVVLMTDVSWHDAKRDPYCASVTKPPSLEDTKKAFADRNARFVDLMAVWSYPGYTPPPPDEAQANELSDATKSNLPVVAFGACKSGKGCCTGVDGAGRAATGPGGTCRLNFLYKSDGTGLTDSVVKAIQAISVGSQFDVTAVPSNDPTNAPGEDGKPVDALQFMKALRAMDEGDAAAGCPAHAAKDTDGDGIKDTFTAVTVGTLVCFEVVPKTNTTVKPKSIAQFFNAFIDVLGMPGGVKLDRRTVLFLVPPTDPIPK